MVLHMIYNRAGEGGKKGRILWGLRLGSEEDRIPPLFKANIGACGGSAFASHFHD
jgi:hypothetical protein